jgi:hypothetical protein
MKALSNWLSRVSSGRIALISLAVFLAFTVLVLPSQARDASAISGEAGTPDLSFFYAPTDLYEMAEAYGESGRAEYIRARFTFDLVWPLIYTLFLVTAISWILQKASPPDSWARGLNLLPLFGASFDYLENVTTSLVMWRYPQQTPLVDWLASIFTPLKWIIIFASFILLVVGIVVVVRNAIQGQTQ